MAWVAGLGARVLEPCAPDKRILSAETRPEVIERTEASSAKQWVQRVQEQPREHVHVGFVRVDLRVVRVSEGPRTVHWAAFHFLIHRHPALLKEEKVELTPEQLRREWKTTQTNSQANIVRTIHSLSECCVGLQGATLLTGCNKLELSLQGFDIFEIMPEFDYLLVDKSDDKKNALTK